MIQIAHGLVARSDLPIPEWLFGWAAAMVLVVSFVALAILWPEPQARGRGLAAAAALARPRAHQPAGRDPLRRDRRLPARGRRLRRASRASQSSTANFAPTFVYVVFWLGLVPASVLFGDVFRAFNPWRAIGRGVAWVAKTAARGDLPAPLAYPERLGRWPAAAGIFAFAALELVASNGDRPENLAIAALIYSALTFIAMALYGVEAWCDRGEAFSVYFNLFSRHLAVRDARAARSGCASRCPVSPALPAGRRARSRCWR